MHRLVKQLAVLAVAVPLFCAACLSRAGDAGGPEPLVGDLLVRYMSGAMADGIVKVAVIRNLSISDQSRQFIEGCVTEGRAMGFTMDVFVTDGDNERCRVLIRALADAGYDGLILSYGDADFTYGALKPAVDRGMKAVTFNALPFEGGDSRGRILDGVSSTFENDEKLAELSLEFLIEQLGRDERPVRVIRAWYGPGVPPLDSRQRLYDEFLRDGRLQEVGMVSPENFLYARDGVREALSRRLVADFPAGSADAIWAPYDEFAKGCADALDEMGRRDLKLVSIDISNDDLKLMADHADIWLAASAIDPRLAGCVNMRLLAAKFAGEPTRDTYTFDAELVETAALNNRITMANVASVVPSGARGSAYSAADSPVVPGWGADTGIFDSYPWMQELKAAKRNYMANYLAEQRRQAGASSGGAK